MIRTLRLEPRGPGLHEFTDALYTHTTEGPDDMPAHIRAALMATSLSVPIESGRLGLGTWQGIFLFEHRHRPGVRSILVHVGG